MSAPIRMRLDGVKEVLDTFRKLEESARIEATAEALADSLEPIAETARALAPVKSGRLRRAIHVFRFPSKLQRRLARAKPAEQYAYVGADYSRFSGKAAKHAHIVEHGSAGRVTKSGRYTGKMPAHPFMRPAFDARAKGAISDFAAAFVRIVLRRAQAK